MSDYIKLTADSVATFFKPRKPESHKGTYGHALIIAGSMRFLGAPVLSARAALRCGCGMCTLASPIQVINAACASVPEAIFIRLKNDPEDLSRPLSICQAAACGMGLSQDTRAQDILMFVLKHCHAPLVLDADALNLISAQKDLCDIVLARGDFSSPLILTPHAGELARLTGVQSKNREHAATLAGELTKKFHAILVLKGHETLVIAPNGVTYQNTTGNPGLARGGSGDVLAGMIVSLCARFTAEMSPPQAALNATLAGVFLHGLASDIAAKNLTQEAMLPSDVINALPNAFKLLLG